MVDILVVCFLLLFALSIVLIFNGLYDIVVEIKAFVRRRWKR